MVVVLVLEPLQVLLKIIDTLCNYAGVATAFAARDILGNVLSGLALQFSKPFSLGDKIKVLSWILL